MANGEWLLLIITTAESASAEFITPTCGSVWFVIGVIVTVLQEKQHAMCPSIEVVLKNFFLMLPIFHISIFDQICNISVMLCCGRVVASSHVKQNCSHHQVV